MFEFRPAIQPSFARRAEHLLEMHVLPLVHDVENEIGVVRAHAIHDRGQIRRPVEHGTIGFQEN